MESLVQSISTCGHTRQSLLTVGAGVGSSLTIFGQTINFPLQVPEKLGLIGLEVVEPELEDEDDKSKQGSTK